MLPYAGVWLSLFVFNAVATVIFAPSAFSALTLMSPALTYSIPVGVLISRRRWLGASGMLLNAAIAPLIGSATIWLLLQAAGFQQATLAAGWLIAVLRSGNSILFAAIGIPLGMAVLNGWTYSRAVFVVTSIMFVLGTAYMAMTWDSYSKFVDSQIVAFETALDERLQEIEVPAYEVQRDALASLKGNKAAIAAGVEFAAYLVLACGLVSLMALVMRRWFADIGIVDSFRNLRPSDWLVWLAIVAVVVWFAERHYGWRELRLISWNMAIGLSAVYFLNGCAIFMYGLHVLAPNLFVITALVFLIAVSGQLPILGVVGFFDTWANFRVRMDRLAKAIRDAQSGES